MDKPTKEAVEDFLKQLTNSDDEPYIITVSSGSTNIDQSSDEYHICSRCYSAIDKLWDHSDWCPAYEEEPVSKWLKKGTKGE